VSGQQHEDVFMPLHAAFFAFLHHVAAFTLAAVIVAQLVLLRGELTLTSARQLSRLDMMLGASAVTVLVVGLLRVFYFEKGSDYYFGSFFFIAKFTLFVISGLLSIIPTLEIATWRKALAAGEVPAVAPERLRQLRMFVHLELVTIVLILLCAAMMARLIEIF
jgi:putative membrane protein